MRYRRSAGWNLCVGSGTVSLCKGLVDERFKRRGMRWSATALTRVLALWGGGLHDRYDDSGGRPAIGPWQHEG